MTYTNKKRNRKPSMSFLTSLALSANNLRTKKGRTIMTGFAGSIGIIGIALILALSSGVNDYIQSIQEDTLSEYPLQITSSQLDISSLLASLSSSSASGNDSSNDSGAEISVTQVITSMFSQVSTNDLVSLKKYIEDEESDLFSYVKAVEYSYDVEPLIYFQEGESYRQVNPDTSLSSSSSILSSLMSSSSTSFYVMPENENLYQDQYEIKAGRWPENSNECVLVLTSDGSISDYLMYVLGLRDYTELESMIEQYNNGEDITDIDTPGTYSYEDVLGITFKVVCSADLYAYDSEYDIWVDKSDNETYMKNLVSSGEDLVIVGVVQPSEDAIGSNLSSGINYPVSLIYHMSELAASSDAVQAQISNPDTNIFTGEPFNDDSEAFDINSLLTIDEDALGDILSTADTAGSLGDAGIDISNIDFDISSLALDLSALNIDLSSLIPDLTSIDMSDLEIDLSEIDLSSMEDELPALNLDTILEQITISPDSLTALINSILTDYQTWQNDTGFDLMTDFTEYLNSIDAQAIISDILNDITYTTVTIDSDELASVIEEAVDSAENSDASTQAVVDAVIAYISENAVISISSDGIGALAEQLIAAYISNFSSEFAEYLESDTVSELIAAGLSDALDLTDVQEQLTAAMNSYMESALLSYTEVIQSALQAQISSSLEQIMSQITDQLASQMETTMESLMSNIMVQITDQLSDSLNSIMSDLMTEISSQMADSLADSFTISSDLIADAFEFNLDSSSLTDLLTSISYSTGTSYNNNLSTLGYVDFDNPSEIDIYPTDFDCKEKVVAILDDYNAQMEQAGESEKIISYTDMVATMMSSVTTIINTISYVLIAFIAVSLLVSCIMISIITQISVIERTKEIGILRAMGASKRNISQVFNAETFIIGTFSGLIGVGITELLIFPINAIIHVLTEDSSINAVLPWNYALILVIISIVITVFSGLIPALRAAKRDPVAALRTE